MSADDDLFERLVIALEGCCSECAESAEHIALAIWDTVVESR